MTTGRAQPSPTAASAAERLFEQFADVAPVLIWVAGPDGRLTFVSRPWLQFTGSRAAEQLGDGWLESVHAEDRDRVRDVRERARVRGEPFEVEFRLRRHDGAHRWVLDRGRPTGTASADGPAGWVGGCVDLHERAEAEEEARLLVDAGRILADALDAESRMDDIAALAVPVLGDACVISLSPDAAPQAPHLLDGVPDELVGALGTDQGSAVVAPLVARGHAFGALTAASRPGRMLEGRELRVARELAYRVALALDNARLYATAREQEQRAEEGRAILDTLIDQAPIGFGYFDTELRYVRVNRALSAINGVSEEDHLGRTVGEVLPDMDPQVVADLRQVLRTGRPLINVEVEGTTPREPRRTRRYLASYYRIQIPGAETLGLGCTVVDTTERDEAAAALEAQRDLYETLLRAQSELGEGFVLVERQRILYVNEAAERIAGRTAAELYDLPSLLDLVAPEARAGVSDRVAAIRTGDGQEPGFETEIITPAGARVAIELAATPLAGDEHAGRLVVLVRDIAERKRQDLERERLLAAERSARAESEMARDRASFLAEVSGVLERSLELSVTLQEVAERMAGTVADVVGIDVLSRDGQTMTRHGIAARDTARHALVDPLRGASFDVRHGNTNVQVALGGTPRVYRRVTVADLRALIESPEAFEIAQRIVGRSLVMLPLRSGGRPAGVLNLSWDEEGHEPGSGEMRLLQEIARRLALAVDNAQLYAERAHIASTLQASLLPPDLPVIAGAHAAARYEPAGEAIEVGGDFYDVFPLPDHAWGILVGDVCGKGAEAAAVTAMARYTLRAATTVSPEGPAAAFAVLNATMTADRVPERFLSAVLGVLSLPPGGRQTLRLACAGHPAPLLLRDGRATPVACHGPLLGIEDDLTWAETTVELAGGDALVLFTDGVTEALRSKPLSPADIGGLLAPGAGDSADALADAVRALAHDRSPGALRDDVAILALKLD